ncbi:MAG: hypothetical protein Q8P24_06120 [Desulfobacterales bacterium]|nr:hypothetical protein [Desulfobacterales bacterium]
METAVRNLKDAPAVFHLHGFDMANRTRDKQVQLDDEAAKLFKQLEGMEELDLSAHSSGSFKVLHESIEEDEKELDMWRAKLIEMMYLTFAFFKDSNLWQGVQKETEFFNIIRPMILKLSRMEEAGGNILVRSRGVDRGTSGTGERGEDYIIRFGPLNVDRNICAALVKRQGIGMQHLPGRLMTAFGTLADFGIHTLDLKLPERDERSWSLLKDCFKILALYFQALKNNAPMILRTEAGPKRLDVITDENQCPCANLTLLAGLNSLPAATMQGIVQKVNQLIQEKNALPSESRPLSVFNAIWSIKSFRERLSKPPIEINSLKWLVADNSSQAASLQKTRVARFVSEQFHCTPLKLPRIMNAVYGNDFKKVDSGLLGRRLETASELLSEMDKGSRDNEMMDEVTRNLKDRLIQVNPEIVDDILLNPGAAALKSDPLIFKISGVHKVLIHLIELTKKGFGVRNKIKNMVGHKIDFSQQDYETLARQFDLDLESSRKLIELLESCFDEQGRFQRRVFEGNIPVFSRFGSNVFEFLWHFLKKTPCRRDRVAFLNSIQLLISRLKQGPQTLRILLEDFLSDPGRPEFKDRNCLMLANLLLREYNQEMIVDVESTPEDVILVRNGLNIDAARLAAEMTDRDPDSFYKKIQSIRKVIMEALESGQGVSAHMPLHFMFCLEKELYIFLTLIGGQNAEFIQRNALMLYGNPDAYFYTQGKARVNLPSLLNQLRLVVRGIGRIGKKKDIGILQNIIDKEAIFRSLKKSIEHYAQVSRIVELCHASQQSIWQRV